MNVNWYELTNHIYREMMRLVNRRQHRRGDEETLTTQVAQDLRDTRWQIEELRHGLRLL